MVVVELVAPVDLESSVPQSSSANVRPSAPVRHAVMMVDPRATQREVRP